MANEDIEMASMGTAIKREDLSTTDEYDDVTKAQYLGTAGVEGVNNGNQLSTMKDIEPESAQVDDAADMDEQTANQAGGQALYDLAMDVLRGRLPNVPRDQVHPRASLDALATATESISNREEVLGSNSELDKSSSKAHGEAIKKSKNDASGPIKLLKQQAVSAVLNLTGLLPFVVSLEEYCAYFPLHVLYWDSLQNRFMAADFQALDCARLVYYHRSTGDPIKDKHAVDVFRDNLIKRQLNIKQELKLEGKVPQLVQDFTPTSLQLPKRIGLAKFFKFVDDCSLQDITNGVTQHPTEAGRRHLTIAIEKAEELGRLDLSLSDLQAFIKEHEIGKDLDPLVAASGNDHPDKQSHQRTRAALAPAKGRRSKT